MHFSIGRRGNRCIPWFQGLSLVWDYRRLWVNFPLYGIALLYRGVMHFRFMHLLSRKWANSSRILMYILPRPQICNRGKMACGVISNDIQVSSSYAAFHRSRSWEILTAPGSQHSTHSAWSCPAKTPTSTLLPLLPSDSHTTFKVRLLHLSLSLSRISLSFDYTRFNNAAMAAYRLFDWAGKQINYTHSVNAYSMLWLSSAKIRQYQIMWELLNSKRETSTQGRGSALYV